MFIALVGECLEALTFERAQRAIGKLLDFYPRTARVLKGDAEVEVSIDQLATGDVIAVLPGERIGVDGTVVRGRSAVDQAVLTGESMPVDKGDGDPVYTGTVNQFGRLEIRADKLGAESTLGQVVRLLADAKRHRSPIERTADRYARRFLPAVLTVAAVVFLATNGPALVQAVTGGTWPTIDLMPTLAVLVVACPCALVLATPGGRAGGHGPAGPARRARQGRRGHRGTGPRQHHRLRQDRHAHRRQARARRLRRSGRAEFERRAAAPRRRGRAVERAPAGALSRRRGATAGPRPAAGR